MRLRAFGAIVWFASGLALGALGYAAIDPSRLSIDTGTRDLLVLAIGAIVTALLVVVAVSLAGATVRKRRATLPRSLRPRQPMPAPRARRPAGRRGDRPSSNGSAL